MKKIRFLFLPISLISSSIALLFPSLAFSITTLPNTFTVSGYVDGSYNYLTRKNQFISGVYNRVYDLEPNGFTLQQVGFTIANQPAQGWGELVNFLMGRDAFITAAYGYDPTTQFDSQTFAIDPLQVYLQYTRNAWTTMVGKFITLTGAEFFDPNLNTHFSSSILGGYAQPNTHTGLRETYAPNNQLSLIVGINNGWDSIRDWGRRKTVELGIAYEMNSFFSFSAQDYLGEERAIPYTDFGPTGTRNLFDLVATFTFTQKISLIFNFDYGWQTTAILPDFTFGRATWKGLASYVNYKISDKWQIALRGEVFNDQNGYRTGVRQNWREATLSLGYSPSKNFLVRAETRQDFSNVDAFVNKNGMTVCNNQQSFALEGVYEF